MRDHPLSVGGISAGVWTFLQPLIFVSLAMLGGGYEATWAFEAKLLEGKSDEELYDGGTLSAQKLYVYGAFMNAFICCILNGIQQDRQRAMAHYPGRCFVLFALIPIISAVAIVIPLQFDGFKTGEVKKAFGIILALVGWDYLYHVQIMGPLFYRLTHVHFEDLKTEKCPHYFTRHCQFELENLKEQQKELAEKVEQKRKQLESLQEHTSKVPQMQPQAKVETNPINQDEAAPDRVPENL